MSPITQRKTIICLMGPTAAGKTALALQLVRELPCSIISVDSGMIYRDMDIGTAKPTFAEQRLAPHRLIDICDPQETYSAARFRRDAVQAIEEIFREGHIPLLVGGTMLYFKVLQYGISPLPVADARIRAELSAIAMQHAEGWQHLHARLQQVDAAAAQRIAPNDAQRIQRALEVYAITGKSMSELHTAHPPIALPYRVLNVVLTPPLLRVDADLQRKIETRLQLMLQQGFVDEVRRLYTRGDLHVDLPALRTVGYRQVWQYLAGAMDYATMQERIVIATRQLAKRQLTWLRSWRADSASGGCGDCGDCGDGDGDDTAVRTAGCADDVSCIVHTTDAGCALSAVMKYLQENGSV